METTIVNMNSSLPELGKHQKKCIDKINEYLEQQDQGVVEMFCGTGKSRIEFDTLASYERSLIVFPSIGLITQFNEDYLVKFNYPNPFLSICSKNELTQKNINVEVTTEEGKISDFIKKNKSFLICCTYQSLETLIKIVKKSKCRFNMTIYDEAHHIIGSEVQSLIFEDLKHLSQKSLFFTATPKNDNGVYMTAEPDHPSTCGEVIFKYTHREAVNDGICRDFEICVKLSLTSSENNVFECIARNALATGNYRILLFHALSNEPKSDRNKNKTSVKSFSSDQNKEEFDRIFNKIRETEFPEKQISKITFKGITQDTKERSKILEDFKTAKEDEVFLISSCQTLKEGIDTKSCNHICWVDARQSYVAIIQNMGRGARREWPCRDLCGTCAKCSDNKKYTITIPISIEKEKYEGCEDQEKRDEVIREEMTKSENWNGILNVLSALRQSDPEFYDLCLNYPNKFCRKEIEKELNIGEKIAQIESENGKEEIDQEEVKNLVDDYCSNKDHPIELFTNSMEEPIKTFGDEKEGKKEILYFDDETKELLKAEEKKEIDEDGVERPVRPPRRKRFNMKVHMDNDLKVLWGIRDGHDLTKEITTVYLDCQVVDNEEKWMENLEGCVKIRENKVKSNSQKPWPSRNSPDSNEHFLSKWLSDMKTILNNPDLHGKGYRNVNEKRKLLLKEFLPEWFDFNPKKEWIKEWIKKLEVCSQIREQKIKTQYPYPVRTSENEVEIVHANWLNKQKVAITNNEFKMTEDKISLLKKKLPEWFELTFSDGWLENLNSCIKIRDDKLKKCDSNPWPNKRSENDLEKKSGRWLDQQRVKINKNELEDERKDQLMKHLPEWFHLDFNLEDKWIQTLNECSQIREQKIKTKYPYPVLSSKNSNEKRLGNWLNKQKVSMINNESKMTEDKISLLKKKLPEWFKLLNLKSMELLSSLNLSTPRSSSSPSPLKPRSYLQPLPNPKHEKSTDTKFNPPHLSGLSTYHKTFKTLHSSTYFSRIKSNPEEFKQYYQLSKQAEENDNPEDLPLHIIAGYIKQYPPNLQVADLGCGDATLATLCPQHQFTNFDVYALNESC
jgi:superfamily II DNA or RNA helicase